MQEKSRRFRNYLYLLFTEIMKIETLKKLLIWPGKRKVVSNGLLPHPPPRITSSVSWGISNPPTREQLDEIHSPLIVGTAVAANIQTLNRKFYE